MNKKLDLSNLKEIRENNNMTQVEVARQVGVGLATYRTWEYNVHQPKAANRKKLKEILPELKSQEG